MGIQAIGILLGGSVGLAIGLLISTLMKMPDDQAIMVFGVAGALGGVMGWFLIRLIQSYFFFIVGAFFGGPLAWKLIKTEPLASMPWTQEKLAPVIAVILGVLGGGLLVLFARRYVIAVLTALLGASMIAFSVPVQNQGLVGAPIFIISAAIQTGFARMFQSKKKD